MREKEKIPKRKGSEADGDNVQNTRRDQSEATKKSREIDAAFRWSAVELALLPPESALLYETRSLSQ